MSANEVSDLYRNRWQIELFFKWMKQHLVLKTWYGKSQNAVYNQIFLAMITFCLTLLMKKKVAFQGTQLEMHEFLSDFWSKSFAVFLQDLFKKPDRSSQGRKRLDHDRIFKETMRQLETGEIDELDSLMYDMIF